MLSAIDATTARPPTIRDVALFTTLPNDLGHVAGVISATPQTPLSHINLKAKQNDTPNAYVRGALTEPRITALLGQVVRYAVTPDDFELEAATAEQVEAWLDAVRPTLPQTPPRDLTLTEIKRPRRARPRRRPARRREGGERRRAAPDAARRHGPRRLRDPVRAVRRVHDRARLLRPRAASSSTTPSSPRTRSGASRRSTSCASRSRGPIRRRRSRRRSPSCRRASVPARASAAARRRTTRTSRASTAPGCTTPSRIAPTRAT